jgi:hypothetical protein
MWVNRLGCSAQAGKPVPPIRPQRFASAFFCPPPAGLSYVSLEKADIVFNR